MDISPGDEEVDRRSACICRTPCIHSPQTLSQCKDCVVLNTDTLVKDAQKLLPTIVLAKFSDSYRHTYIYVCLSYATWFHFLFIEFLYFLTVHKDACKN